MADYPSVSKKCRKTALFLEVGDPFGQALVRQLHGLARCQAIGPPRVPSAIQEMPDDVKDDLGDENEIPDQLPVVWQAHR
ncbi:MAG TPA: hypothetical protein VHR67_03180 [Aestuariivirgaceae bacterium]|jgi:hypothetical protein|nr:hypothetical protein [Aestuariivirgaceae bacterium]